MPRVTPFLWFDDNAEEAVRFYASVFENSKVGQVSRGVNGSAMVVEFEIDGQRLIALNGGPRYKLNEAFSLLVHCETQDEIDYYWNALSAGPETEQCGWLMDRFGLSWQVVPTLLSELAGQGQPANFQRMMKSLFGMKKLDIAAMQAAYDGG